MIDTLQDILLKLSNFEYVELRHHRAENTVIRIVDGTVEEASSGVITGTGIRVLQNGAWGFAATNSPNKKDIVNAGHEAGSMARKGSKYLLSPSKLADIPIGKQKYQSPNKFDLRKMPIEEKFEKFTEASTWIQKQEKVASYTLDYTEYNEEVSFVSSEGNCFQRSSQKPTMFSSIILADKGKVRPSIQSHFRTCGAEFFDIYDPLETTKEAYEEGIRLLGAQAVKGGKHNVVLDYNIVGLLAHEAIGHTAESDLVKSGSFLKDKQGENVASELVTLCDSPVSEDAAGWLPIDDEGVIGKTVEIIKDGVLNGYLVNRIDAKIMDLEPTGNARAFTHRDIPIVRMRNTYFEVGDMSEEELIELTKSGYYIKGVMNGEADFNGEFMFGAREALEIKNGELTGVSFVGPCISGNSFDVLQSVVGVGKTFRMDLGTGFCGKIQPAIVDGGGPLLACTALLGGT
ncbi:MAG: TldD/PmbA family protein [Candidatus Hodarchaeota archaeon]